MTRILVTGSRVWPDAEAVRDALNEALTAARARGETLTVVVGDCPTGADAHALKWALRSGVRSEVHVADWRTHGRAAGPIRNRHMIDSGIDVVYAFPYGESRGTRGTMRLAEAEGIPVHNYERKQP